MKNSKTIKLLIGIVLILILVIVTILLTTNQEKKESNVEDDVGKEYEIVADDDYSPTIKLQEFNDINMYFNVKKIIEKFYSSCTKMNITAEDVPVYKSTYKGEELQQYKEKYAEEMQNEAIEKIYNTLSVDFINELKITNQNIKEKLSTKNKYEPIIEKIYRFQNSNNVWTYLVKGIAIDSINQESEYFNLGVTVDIYNKTYCIYPQEYLEKKGYDKLKLDETVNFKIDEIKSNKDNMYKFEIVNDDEICKEYFNKLKKLLLYDENFLYEMLDKEYKEKRFQNIKEFKEWKRKNYDNINSSVVTKYQVTNEDGTKRYVCQDNNGNYYLFKKTDTIDFNIQLDTYTISTKEFIEKYNKENEKTKAEMNIENIFQAINRKDYNYIYTHLDENFKNNNFSDLDSLEKYFETYLFDINAITSDGYSNEGVVQIFKIKVSDKKDNDRTKNMNVNIKIEKDTDFVMSFNIE